MTHMNVHHSSIELDNGETLLDLAVGDYLELTEPVAGLHPGTWQLKDWNSDGKATMRHIPTDEVMKLRKEASDKLAALFRGDR